MLCWVPSFFFLGELSRKRPRKKKGRKRGGKKRVSGARSPRAPLPSHCLIPSRRHPLWNRMHLAGERERGEGTAVVRMCAAAGEGGRGKQRKVHGNNGGGGGSFI